MVLARDFIELAGIEEFREFIEVEHRVVLALLAKKRDVFTEIHVFKAIGDKASVTTLYALSEFLQNVIAIN